MDQLVRDGLVEIVADASHDQLAADLSELLARFDVVPEPGATLGRWLIDQDAVADVFR